MGMSVGHPLEKGMWELAFLVKLICLRAFLV